MPIQRPTLPDLKTRTASDMQSRLGLGPLLPRSTLKVISEVVAGSAHQLYGYIAWAINQLFPDSAEAEYLNRWATIYGVQRNAATFAMGNVTFSGTAGSVIPSGTVLQRGDGLQYTTTAEVTLVGSPAAGTVGVISLLAGLNNNTATGQNLSMVSPISGVSGVVTVASGGLAGGADTESDANLRSRLMLRLSTPPQGGARNDYLQWALSVAGVTRAWVYPLNQGAGTVGVTFVTDGEASPIPSAQKVTEVQNYINARRPVTANVTVFAPTPQPLNLAITISPNTQAVKDAVVAELKDLFSRTSVPGGTIYKSKLDEAISIAPGEFNHVLTAPTADVVAPAGTLITLGTITWS